MSVKMLLGHFVNKNKDIAFFLSAFSLFCKLIHLFIG